MNGHLPSFGPFAFDALGRSVARDGVALPLGQRAFRLLAALAGAQGRVLTKDELIRAGWGDQAVEESNLTVQIAAIRKALGRRPDGDEWIATVNRVGYRLVLSDKPPAEAASQSRLDGTMRCAVLPFRSDSRDDEQVRFCEGLADDLITDLSRLPDLRVTTRGSSFRYDGSSIPLSQVSRELGARYIIQGSVRRDGAHLRVNVHVIDAHDNAHAWGARFDGEMTDLFSLQDRIATDLVVGLTSIVRPHLPPRSRAADPETNDLFLRGRALVSQWSSENVPGRRLLVEALERDPSFARAHAWLAHSHHFAWLFDYESDGTDRHKAITHAKRAMLLDGNEPDACWSFGLACAYTGDLDAALRHLRRALELNPSHADAWVFMADVLALNGQAEQAIDCVKNALALNPFPPALYIWHLGFNQYMARRYEDAEVTLRRAARDRDGPKRILAATLARLGRQEEAETVAREFMRTHPTFSIRLWAERHPFRHEEDKQHFVVGYRMAGLPD
ncbi:winged helix-turn-helix domain-containing protein [Nostoc sp. NIES-2111]